MKGEVPLVSNLVLPAEWETCSALLFWCVSYFLLLTFWFVFLKDRFVSMFVKLFSHLIRDSITVELEILQFRKVVDAGEGIIGPVLGECPDDLLELRSRSSGEVNLVDVGAVDDKNVELWKVIFVEGKIAFIIRLV